MAKTVKTIHMIDGRNVVDMSNDELINEIAATEAKIKELGKLNTESTAIEAEKKRLEKFIAQVVKHLDKRSS